MSLPHSDPQSVLLGNNKDPNTIRLWAFKWDLKGSVLYSAAVVCQIYTTDANQQRSMQFALKHKVLISVVPKKPNPRAVKHSSFFVNSNLFL